MLKKFVYGDKEGKEAAAAASKDVRKSKDFICRRLAVAELGKLQHEAAPYADAFDAALLDEDAGVRYWAAIAFSTLGPAAAKHLEVLAKGLEDTDPGVRLWVVEAIGQLKAEAISLVDALEKRFADEDTHVRIAATRAVMRIDPTAAPRAAAIFAECLRDDEEVYFRACAADALGILGSPAAMAHVTIIVDALSDSSASVRAAAASTLGQLGPAAVRPAASALAVLSKSDPNEQVRSSAWEAMGLLNPSQSLRDEDVAMRLWAVRRFAAGEVPAEAHVQDLAELLSDAESSIRLCAAAALEGVKTAAAPYTAALLRLLEDPLPEARVAAMKAITASGDEAIPQAIQVLVGGLSCQEPELRAASAQALMHAGVAVQPHTEALKRALADPEDIVRVAVIRTLAGAGRTAVRDCGPVLGKMALTDPDIDVRRSAKKALLEYQLGVKFGLPRE